MKNGAMETVAVATMALVSGTLTTVIMVTVSITSFALLLLPWQPEMPRSISKLLQAPDHFE